VSDHQQAGLSQELWETLIAYPEIAALLAKGALIEGGKLGKPF